eukprot:430752_1
MRQKIGSKPIINTFADVHSRPDGTFISHSHTFTKQINVDFEKQSKRAVTAEKSVLYLAEFVKIKLKHKLTLMKADPSADRHDKIFSAVSPMTKPATADLVWFQMSDGRVELVWHVVVHLENAVYDACILSEANEIVQLYDWVHWFHAYDVYAKEVISPEDGERAIKPEIFDISQISSGWHYDGSQHYNDTRGNNVWAQENWDNTKKGGSRPTLHSDGTFDAKIDLTKGPKSYVDASIINLFYHNNLIHDVLYRFGFNEVSGNFQKNNWGKGGKANDAVIAHTQDGSGTNNANFMTPQDGWNPKMRMYIWTYAKPGRDSSFNSDIVYHEYMHGVSTRLTGGPSNVWCLRVDQSAGMGEGWGDFFGLMLRTKVGMNRTMKFGVGGYVANKFTIRPWPYSSDKKVAPQMYNMIGSLHAHSKGAVWATMLFEVYWNLVDGYGFDPAWLHGSAGNHMMAQLVLDGMKLQPCTPKFTDARDAILKAADESFAGDDWLKCLIWDGFASRGLGVNADGCGDKNDKTVPEDCKKAFIQKNYKNYARNAYSF